MWLYFYHTIVCTGVFGKSTWVRFWQSYLCRYSVERRRRNVPRWWGSVWRDMSGRIGRDEKNVIPSSGFTSSRYTRLPARGKTLPVPNPPTTGNRRPFQFLLLSRLRFNFPFTPACFWNNPNPYLRVGMLFTWRVHVRVREKSVSRLKTVCALDKTAVGKISMCWYGIHAFRAEGVPRYWSANRVTRS